MIRQCHAGDLEPVCNIAFKAWSKIFDYLENAYTPELYNIVNPNCRYSKTPALYDFFQQHPEWFFVAERNGRVVGFITFTLNRATASGTICNNAVDPDCGEKGVGQEMYKAVLDYFRSQGMKAAMVTTGNDPAHAPARRAYERAGFKLKTEQVFYIMDLQGKN